MNEDIIIVYLHMLLFILNCTQFVLTKIKHAKHSCLFSLFHKTKRLMCPSNYALMKKISLCQSGVVLC